MQNSFEPITVEELNRRASIKADLVIRLESIKSAAKRIISSEDFKIVKSEYDKIERILIDDILGHNEIDPNKYAFYVMGKIVELRTFRTFIRSIESEAKEIKHEIPKS